MTDFAPLLQPDRGGPAHAIHLVDKDSFAGWLKAQPAPRRALLEAQRFDGKTAYQFAILPGEGSDASRSSARSRMSPSCRPGAWPNWARRCPKATIGWPTGEPGLAAFGWLVGQHRFTRYKKPQGRRAARASC